MYFKVFIKHIVNTNGLHFTDLEIPLNESSDGEDAAPDNSISGATSTSAANAANAANTANMNSANTANANVTANANSNSNSGRLPALRLVLSAGGNGGASLALERPAWTLYRCVLALHARLPAHDAHRDTTYT